MTDSYSITIRGYTDVPLFSPKVRGEIADAVRNLNFASEQELRAAREVITQMPWVRRFCDWAFHGGDKAKSLDAFATLHLYKLAEVARVVPTALHADRATARATLAARLSPASKQALKECCEVSAGRHDFSNYISAQDRHGMLGDVSMKEGHDHRFAGFLAVFELLAWTPTEIAARTVRTDTVSAEAYQIAAEAYTRAHLPEQAKAAWVALATDAQTAAGVYAQADLSERAADAWLRAADAYALAELPEQAAPAYQEAAKAYLDARQYRQAEAAFSKAKHSYLLTGDERRAERVDQQVRDAEALHGDLLDVEGEQRIGDIQRPHDPLVSAATALLDAAGDDIVLEHFERAVGSATRAATLYTQAKWHFDAGQAWERVALASFSREQKDGAGVWRVPGKEAVEMAKAAYRQADRPERVVFDYWGD